MKIEMLPMARIYPREDDLARPIVPGKVVAIAGSFKEIGQRQPIGVRAVRRWACGVQIDAFEIVFGNHRYEAAKTLGYETIAGEVLAADDLRLELVMIAENLHRAELSALEHDEQVKKWDRIVQELNSRQSDAKSKDDRNPKGSGRHKGGVRQTARELDLSEAAVRRAHKVANLSDDAKQVARETGLDDNRSAMLKAAAEPKDKQADKMRAIAQDKARPKVQQRRPLNPIPVTCNPISMAWLQANLHQRHEFLEMYASEIGAYGFATVASPVDRMEDKTISASAVRPGSR